MTERMEGQPPPNPEQPTPAPPEGQLPQEAAQLLGYLADLVARRMLTTQGERAPQPESPSEFQLKQTAYVEARHAYAQLEGPNISQDRLKAAKEAVMEMIREANDKHDLLVEVRQQTQDEYKQLRSEPLATRLDMLRARRFFGDIDWERDIWNEPPHAFLANRFRGVLNCLYLEIREGVKKEAVRQSLKDEVVDKLIRKRDPRIFFEKETNVGDDEFVQLKLKRERERLKETKFQPTQMEQLRFSWAEDDEELVPTVQEWLSWAQKDVSDEATERQYKKIEESRDQGLHMLSLAVIRLNNEYGLNLKPDSGVIKRLKYLIESDLNAFGGDRCVNRGGFEYLIHFKANYAANFTAHWSATYLEDPATPLAFHLLSENDGEYWRGCTKKEDRPSDGEVEAFQKAAQNRMIQHLATHELILKHRFETKKKEERERMILWSPEKRKDREREIFAEERDKFLKEHQVFIETKARWDKKDAEEADARGIPELKGLIDAQGNLVDEEARQEIVRRIIRKKMAEEDLLMAKKTRECLEKIDQAHKNAEIDALLWKWVKDRNKAHKDIGWYPTRWDEIRLLIDRPERVLARALTREEFLEMYQPIDFASLDDDEQVRRVEAVDQAFQRARTYMVFEGVASRYGGTRLEMKDPNTKELIYSPFFAELWGILGKVPEIDLSSRPKGKGRDAEKARLEWYKEQQEKGEIRVPLIRADGKEVEIVVKGSFLIRDILRQYKVAGRLPVWSFYLTASDPLLLEFAKMMEVSPKDKERLTELIENERRILENVKDQLVDYFMYDPDVLTDPNQLYHFKIDTSRVNWKGGNIDIRKIENARMYFSTSAMVATELSPILDLGVNDFWEEMGCEDAREFTGRLFRRDELEHRQTSLIDVLDPIDHNKRLASAEELRKIIGGGRLKDRYEEGFLNSPLKEAYKIQDAGVGLFVNLVRSVEEDVRWTYDDYDKFAKHIGSKEKLDNFRGVVLQSLEPLTKLFEARRYVENRYPGRVTRNWVYDNTRIWYRFKAWLRWSDQYRKEPLGYANAARSEFVLRVMEEILEFAGYIMTESDRQKHFLQEFENDPKSGKLVPRRVNRFYNAKDDKIYFKKNNGQVIEIP